jgi:hypothetical protein
LHLAATGQWSFKWVLGVTVALFTWLDEVGNDWIDRRPDAGRFAFLLKYRFLLKFAVLILCLARLLPWLYLLAFLLFDAGYALLTVLGRRIKARKAMDYCA